MHSRTFPHELIPPPDPFPTWQGGGGGPLVYLAWGDPPSCLGKPDPAVLHPVRFRPEQIRMLEDLHRQTRMEIFQPQRHGDSALVHLSGLIEIQFARSEGPEASDPDDILLGRAKQWMFEHLSQIATMADLAQYLGISVMRLHRLFHAGTGMSPGAFYHDVKMKHCAGLLSRPAYSVKRVAYESGYRHANDFSRAFKTHFGYSPSEQARS